MNKWLQGFLEKNKKMLFAHLISLGILLLGLVLCRYVFFNLHGMKEWPFDLLLFGLAALLLSLLARKQYAPWFTSTGYFLGFWIAFIFHTHGFDPAGGKTDNFWGIWMVAFFCCILAGFLFEVVVKWWRLLKNRKV